LRSLRLCEKAFLGKSSVSPGQMGAVRFRLSRRALVQAKRLINAGGEHQRVFLPGETSCPIRGNLFSRRRKVRKEDAKRERGIAGHGHAEQARDVLREVLQDGSTHRRRLVSRTTRVGVSTI